MDKKENIKKILEKIQEAEYVLVGLGQYFDMQSHLTGNSLEKTSH